MENQQEINKIFQKFLEKYPLIDVKEEPKNYGLTVKMEYQNPFLPHIIDFMKAYFAIKVYNYTNFSTLNLDGLLTSLGLSWYILFDLFPNVVAMYLVIKERMKLKKE